VARFDHEIAQLADRQPALCRRRHRAGGHRTDQRLLVEVEANAVLDAAVNELVVRKTVAERVDKSDLPIQPLAEQGLGDLRQLAVLVADTILVRSPVDDVHGSGFSAREADSQAVVVALEIGGYGQRRAEAASSLSVFVVGDVGRPVGQDDDRRVLARARRRATHDAVEQLVGDRVHRTRLGKSGRKRVGERFARRERVRKPRRGPKVVLEHEKLAIGIAHDIEPDDGGGRHMLGQASDQVGFIALRILDQLGRDDARPHDLALTIGVEQEAIQCARALGKALGERIPFGGGDEARHGIGHERLCSKADSTSLELLRHRPAQILQIGSGQGAKCLGIAGPMQSRRVAILVVAGGEGVLVRSAHGAVQDGTQIPCRLSQSSSNASCQSLEPSSVVR
jgi:hypothetical protein